MAFEDGIRRILRRHDKVWWRANMILLLTRCRCGGLGKYYRAIGEAGNAIAKHDEEDTLLASETFEGHGTAELVALAALLSCIEWSARVLRSKDAVRVLSEIRNAVVWAYKL